MVGVPGESLQDVRSTMALNRAAGVDYQRVTLCAAVKDTDIYRRALALGLVDEGAEAIDLTDDVDELAWRRAPSWGREPAEAEAMMRHYLLFRLFVRWPGLEAQLGEALLRLPSKTLRPLAALAMVDEARFNRVGLVDGLRFIRHAGHGGRANVLPSLL